MKIFNIGMICLLLLSCSDDDETVAEVRKLKLESLRFGSQVIDLGSSATHTDVPVDRPVTFIFTNPVDPNSVEEAIYLTQGGTEVELQFSFLSENKAIIADHDKLKYNTEYKIVVSDKLRGMENEEFDELNINFITADGELEINSITIGEENFNSSQILQDIPLTFDLVINFSEDLDEETDFADYFSLIHSDIDYPLQFVLSPEKNELTIRPQDELEPLAKYQFNIASALKSETGFNFDGFTREFYTQIDSTYKFPEIPDEELLTNVQEQTFKYFWDFAHTESGMARERNTSGNLVTTGGSGFGVMVILAGIERGFITRQEGVDRLEKIVNFLKNADRFHGVWPHWMNGTTGEVIPFSQNDDGGDLVETAFMIQGLLTVREYLNSSDPQENAIIQTITQLWEDVEWDWYTKDGQNVLYWHWSPNYGWEKNLHIRGWNESLIIYVLAASSPTHPIDPEVYHEGWARSGAMVNGNSYYDIQLPLGNSYGGPLFFSHYSFLGLDPRNLEDQYADYWEQNVAHSRINQQHAVVNPNHYIGYGENAWGFTASDDHEGYSAHSPTNDKGVITPTAALSSFPYTPEHSMDALHHFYYLMGDKLWGEYGFYDAYNPTAQWYADSFLAIDQGPIIIMIENYRSGLFWELFMQNEEVLTGLEKLGFTYE